MTTQHVTITNGGTLVVQAGAIPIGSDVTAIEALTGTGLVTRTAANTYATRSIAKSDDGLAVTNGDGVAGNPTIALADDVAAIEALAGTGYAKRTAPNTWELAEITTASEITWAPSARVDDGSPTGWTTATTVRLVPTASVVVTGLAARSAGTSVELRNLSTYLVVLACGPTTSAAANRLTNDSGGGHVLMVPGDVVRLVYDGTSARWQVIRVHHVLRDTGMRRRWLVSNGSTVNTDGMTVANSTGTTPTPTTGSYVASLRRHVMTTSGSGTNQTASIRHNTDALFLLGGSGLGGCCLSAAWGTPTMSNNKPSMFCGWFPGTGLGVGVAYSNMTNCAGFSIEVDETTWRFQRNDGSGVATRTDLGSGFPRSATAWYQSHIYSDPAGGAISYAIWRADDTTVLPAVGDVTSDLPAVTLGPWWGGNSLTDTTNYAIAWSQFAAWTPT